MTALLRRAPILLLLFAPALCLAGAHPLLGMGTDRAHQELRLREFESPHFIIIHPDHLEAEARRAAAVAEQIYLPVCAGMGLDGLPFKTGLFLTDEDETINGFALPRRMCVFTHLNDYAARFGGRESWLRQVIAHEFQHVVWLEVSRDWTGFWSWLTTPAWYIEGLAEYHTETWGPGRSDLAVRSRFIEGAHDRLGPHDAGFAKVRYLAAVHGDSVVAAIPRGRNALGLGDWRGAFIRATGVTPRRFEEEWRRAVTAYAYALRSQKERPEQAGEVLPAPRHHTRALAVSPDSGRVALIGRAGFGEIWTLSLRSGDRHLELDTGVLGDRPVFSPDGRRLAWAKKHRAAHGEMVWDIKVADCRTGRVRWLTNGRGARYPDWRPDGRALACVVDGGAAGHIDEIALDGAARRLFTSTANEQRLFDLAYAPDGERLACARFLPGHGLHVAVIDPAAGELTPLASGDGRDRTPLWDPAGRRLWFTSTRDDLVPNIFTVDPAVGEASVERVTDTGEALTLLCPLPPGPAGGGWALAAAAMAVTDSTRLFAVDPDRRVARTTPSIRPDLLAWLRKRPPVSMPEGEPTASPALSAPRPYRSWRRLDCLFRFAAPSPKPWGVAGAAFWSDKAQRQSLLAAVEVGVPTDGGDPPEPRAAYLRWDTIALRLPGVFTLAAGRNAGLGLSLYGDRVLYDTRDFVDLRWRLPLNRGEHLHANHVLAAAAGGRRVRLRNGEDFAPGNGVATGLAAPLPDYEQRRVRLSYLYRRQAPHRHVVPRAGTGLRVVYEWSGDALGGDLDYQRLRIDLGRVLDPPLPGVLNLRVRRDAAWGSVAPREAAGLRAEPGLRPFAFREAPIVLEDLLAPTDHIWMRGLRENLIGESCLAGVAEWSCPLTPALPISIGGCAAGRLRGSLFLEHGRVRRRDGDRPQRTSWGWELTLPLRLPGGIDLLAGWGAGHILPWGLDGAPRDTRYYWSVGLADPF